jgi:hypothetical protein
MKRLNILKTLAETKWGADQFTLLRVHEMMILSALVYGSAAYGSARRSKLKRVEVRGDPQQRIACCIGSFLHL